MIGVLTGFVLALAMTLIIGEFITATRAFTGRIWSSWVRYEPIISDRYGCIVATCSAGDRIRRARGQGVTHGRLPRGVLLALPHTVRGAGGITR